MHTLSMLFQDFSARLCSAEFLQDARHPAHPAAFSRCRKLPLPTLVAVMLTGMRMSIQAELDTFFAHLRQQAQLAHHARLIGDVPRFSTSDRQCRPEKHRVGRKSGFIAPSAG
jgi:hypothetical protein